MRFNPRLPYTTRRENVLRLMSDEQTLLVSPEDFGEREVGGDNDLAPAEQVAIE